MPDECQCFKRLHTLLFHFLNHGAGVVVEFGLQRVTFEHLDKLTELHSIRLCTEDQKVAVFSRRVYHAPSIVAFVK